MSRTLLVKVQSSGAPPGDPRPPVSVSLDVGRTLGLTAVMALLIVAAVVLFITGHDTPGYGFVTLAEAILVGGFGIALGEQRGAEAASAAPPA